MPIAFTMIAKNSSGVQELTFRPDEENKVVCPTLYGELNGDEIQIDFNCLDELEMDELINYLKLQRSKISDESIDKGE